MLRSTSASVTSPSWRTATSTYGCVAKKLRAASGMRGTCGPPTTTSERGERRFTSAAKVTLTGWFQT
jgi:hypothetical protein